MRRTKGGSLKVTQVIGLLLLCICIILLSYNVTTAWFFDESVTSNGDGEPNIVVVGTIDLDVTTNFDFYNLALAPDTVYTTDQDNNDIATYISTSSENDIEEVYVRVKFTTDRNELSLYFDNNITTATEYVSDTEGNWVYEGYWVYNETDSYYYYLGGVGSTQIKFNSGYIVDNTLTNSVAGMGVNLSMEIEAIQKPYGAYKAVWTTAPKIFNTFAKVNSGV